jgi:hypothetical protein
MISTHFDRYKQDLMDLDLMVMLGLGYPKIIKVIQYTMLGQIMYLITTALIRIDNLLLNSLGR